MAVNLTNGAIMTMCFTKKELQPVLQIIDLEVVQSPHNSSTERYRLMISDGSYYQHGMLATPRNELIHSGRLQKGSVFKVTQFICNDVQKRKIIIIIELDVILDKCDLIGEPVLAPKDPPAQYATGSGYSNWSDPVRYGACNALPSYPKVELGVSFPRSAPLSGSYGDQNKEQDTLKLEDLISMLSAESHKSFPLVACSSVVQDPGSSESRAVELMQNLKDFLNHPFDTLCFDEGVRGNMLKIVEQLVPVRNHLPLENQELFSMIQDFLPSLTVKVSLINKIIPSYQKEEAERENTLKQLTDMKNEMDRQVKLYTSSQTAQITLNQQIARLRQDLREFEEHKKKLDEAMARNLNKQQKIQEDAKLLTNKVIALVDKRKSLEPDYQDALAVKESLETTWETLKTMQS